ncbi:lysylphosphatidylglycerol synthase transmembrane domain-containing protein [Carboxylicivirga caseinilyticus]|uniref:lysylphosphatidylglycerol synthase transmembrane domain-containing protein n=1 Tax=Carboxylicivirga caseinilyticus TaxID=3417572 RepID=UPI003D32E5E4|nr:flippase-like domain-containing protein [Marinilabiliaceae bacterium A049]
MKKQLSKLIQYILFPSIGLFIIWQLYKDQKADEILQVLKNDVDFKWIGLSVVLGLLSHLSRALRWQMLIEPVERKPRLSNTFWAVMTGYLANLVFPRMGEVSRCGVISKYEKMSFTRVVGTVVAERLSDLLMLVLITIVVLILQFDLFLELLQNNVNISGITSLFTSPIFYAILALIVICILVVFRFSSRLSFLSRLRNLWHKFYDGLQSYRKIKNVPAFIFHTLFIWTMYFLMIYVCFFSMNQTSGLTIDAGITILLTGSLGMLAPVQGGIGPWHFMVIATLKLYGIAADSAGVFALVVHAAQNTMIIVVGLIAFIVLPFINRPSNAS